MNNNAIKDYYYILGLSKNASKEQIKMAYRKLSVKFHPDKNNGDKFFEERFKDIQEAYETLMDDEQRAIYDDELNRSGTTSSSYAETASPKPYPKKNRTRDILLGILGLMIISSPFLKGVINRLKEKNGSDTYNLVRYDTANHRVIDSAGTPITIHRDTTTLASNDPQQTAGPGSLNPSSSNENLQTPDFKDDDGLTAQDAVNYFLNALNNNDCNTAWMMSYNATWVNRGKDWFCSSEAFGTVKKISVRNTYLISLYRTVADIYADYYSEDPNNGNKCFKQDVRVQKIEYTDGKLRWKITKMTNAEPPVDCYEN